jgi:predicted phage tail component-like protein
MRNTKFEQFIYNGVNLNQYVRANPTRTLAPNMTHQTAQLIDREMHLRTNLDPLSIPVKIELRTRTKDPRGLAKLRRMLRGVFYSKEPKKLVLPDDPEIYYMASVEDASELDNLWNTGSCTITFKAFDPVAYGESRYKTLTSGLNTVEIEGTYETYPVFTLKATGNNVKVENVDTGEYVQVSATTSSGATVTIDMDGEGTTRVNTNLSAVVLGSIYFPLQPGTNQVRLTNATGTVDWIERWV